jgi:hypothetical protein
MMDVHNVVMSLSRRRRWRCDLVGFARTTVLDPELRSTWLGPDSTDPEFPAFVSPLARGHGLVVAQHASVTHQPNTVGDRIMS